MREETQEEMITNNKDIMELPKEKMKQQKEKLKQHEEQWKLYNKMIFNICMIIGTIIAIYVGGWIMFVKSILGTYVAYTTGTLTFAYVVKALIKCVTAATVAGAIWCIGYILGRKLER